VKIGGWAVVQSYVDNQSFEMVKKVIYWSIWSSNKGGLNEGFKYIKASFSMVVN
jgi:hypothetical protein